MNGGLTAFARSSAVFKFIEGYSITEYAGNSFDFNPLLIVYAITKIIHLFYLQRGVQKYDSVIFNYIKIVCLIGCKDIVLGLIRI